ncbi:MAG: papain-like cysteine protease family protein [Candidatus Bathyarchaeia archaeon]
MPLFRPLQADGYSCVPRCVRMIFDYVGVKFGGCVPSLDISEIAEVIETKIDGTLPEKVANLNRDRRVLKAVPSIEFDVDLRSYSLADIEKEIADERPVIAWVEVSNGVHRFVHAVVVSGVDRDKGLIYYNDPIFGEKEEEIGAFMSRWEKLDRIMIKVKIGKRRMLDEFFEEKVEES